MFLLAMQMGGVIGGGGRRRKWWLSGFMEPTVHRFSTALGI